MIVTAIEFDASLADFPFNEVDPGGLAAAIVENLLQQEHSSQGVELRLYEIKGEELNALCILAGFNAIHTHSTIDLLQTHPVTIQLAVDDVVCRGRDDVIQHGIIPPLAIAREESLAGNVHTP